MIRLLAGASALLMGSAGLAFAGEPLSLEGARLENVSYPPGGALEIRVDAAGDEVLSAHAILRLASTNIALMRDRDGFWTDFSGRREDLIESAAYRDGDDLVFKIFRTPPEGLLGPLTVTVAYRTEAGLKFGWLQAGPASGESE